MTGPSIMRRINSQAALPDRKAVLNVDRAGL